ncbi:MAG: pathogenicity island protein [Staphylococcus sp.]|nr:pathogenicity island protein [Staphylococcus sp.]MDU3987917.1 pathogenicity island protein [Staphylococcus sp.]
MDLEQRYKLSVVAREMDKVINHSKNLTKNFNYIAESSITETDFIEKALKEVNQKLFNILFHLKFSSEEYQIISEIIETFDDVMKEKQDIYTYSVVAGGKEEKYTTNRKGHLIGILEWALDYIVGNIDVGVIE